MWLCNSMASYHAAVAAEEISLYSPKPLPFQVSFGILVEIYINTYIHTLQMAIGDNSPAGVLWPHFSGCYSLHWKKNNPDRVFVVRK